MKTKLLPMLLAAAMFPAMPVQATVDSCITALNLTIRMQGDITTNDDVETGKVIVVRLGAKQILSMLEDALNADFPVGACLFVTVDGDVLVVDKDENPIVDVSSYISANLDLENSIFKGTYNVETEQENAVYHFVISFEVDIPGSMTAARGVDGGVQVEIQGVAKEQFNASKPKNDGDQTFRGTITSGLEGAGSVDGETAVVEGNLLMAGSETED